MAMVMFVIVDIPVFFIAERQGSELLACLHPDSWRFLLVNVAGMAWCSSCRVLGFAHLFYSWWENRRRHGPPLDSAVDVGAVCRVAGALLYRLRKAHVACGGNPGWAIIALRRAGVAQFG